jgi:hypothetical protein
MRRAAKFLVDVCFANVCDMPAGVARTNASQTNAVVSEEGIFLRPKGSRGPWRFVDWHDVWISAAATMATPTSPPGKQ